MIVTVSGQRRASFRVPQTVVKDLYCRPDCCRSRLIDPGQRSQEHALRLFIELEELLFSAFFFLIGKQKKTFFLVMIHYE